MGLDLTPKTRRIIVGVLGIINVFVALGWLVGKIPAEEAMLAISPTITGFFALLNSGD